MHTFKLLSKQRGIYNVIKKITKLCLAGTLALGSMGTALAADDAATSPFAAENFSATLTMTSNYMYRGISFSSDSAALQGSFDWWLW